jgi:transglutaminase-like putative cysteine protease
MNFAIRYFTEYRYAEPIMDNLNALRVRPATTSTQRCDEFDLRVDPETRLTRHIDYFGTEVAEFGVSRSHDRLTIDARARVVTNGAPEPPDASWSALAAPAYRNAAGEFLLPTGGEPPNSMLDDLHALTAARSPLTTVLLLTELVRDRFEYRRGATYVGSTVEHLLEVGAGVCQDFVHLALMLLRRRGIAARYVSGYLFAAPQDGTADSVEVDTHAWLEALMPGAGGGGQPFWVGADPTNGGLAGEQHVKIGHGRHYADVPPIKGVYRGSGAAELDVSVQMTRLDPAASARA